MKFWITRAWKKLKNIFSNKNLRETFMNNKLEIHDSMHNGANDMNSVYDV
jgi:hypothetical protein